MEYSFFPHTADIGLNAEGGTLAQLFVHAAEGMFAYLAAPAEEKKYFHRTVEVEAPDPESLLVAWLNELLYIYSAQKVVLDSFDIKDLNERRMTAEVHGRRALPGARALHEIKAATYHNLQIQRTKNRYHARLIFDV